MALFAIWRNKRGSPETERFEQELLDEVPYHPEDVVAAGIQTITGHFGLAAFSTTTRFLAPAEQVAVAPDSACVLHGYAWRSREGSPHVVTASEAASQTSRSEAESLLGAFALVRVCPDGRVIATNDSDGLHHLYFAETADVFALSNRASFLPVITGRREKDTRSLLWIPAVGYRIGEGTSYKIARAVPQGHSLVFDHTVELPRRDGYALDIEAVPRGYFKLQQTIDRLLAEGVDQAISAMRLAVGNDETIELPITGGKDSRVLLALALAAGFRERLRLFTAGEPDHPDVVVGSRIAESLRLPFRSIPPAPRRVVPTLAAADFVSRIARFAFLSDGMTGAWDIGEPQSLGRAVLLTGNMGEVLKAYAKRPFDPEELDLLDLVALQSPFDPLGLLSSDARTSLRAELSSQLHGFLAAGSFERADLPDIFYYRNRIPNWLGGLHQLRAFDVQLVMPLGVPAFVRAAFLVTAHERKIELLHFLILRALAPDLLAVPFGMQTWHPGLSEYSAGVEALQPVTLPKSSHTRLFGSWQYSLNHNPALRAALVDMVRAEDRLELWTWLDRDRLLQLLSAKEFSYIETVSVLGLLPVMLFEAERSLRVRIGDPLPRQRVAPRSLVFRGSLDFVKGTAVTSFSRVNRDQSEVALSPSGDIVIVGWAKCDQLPGSRVAVELVTSAGQLLARVPADRRRPDLAGAGPGDGKHAFRIELEAEELQEACPDGLNCTLAVRVFETGYLLGGGRILFRSSSEKTDALTDRNVLRRVIEALRPSSTSPRRRRRGGLARRLRVGGK